MARVSYVVTVYNKQAYLPLVLYALSVQTGDFDKEYIFVNDGSTDQSLAILREWEDRFPGDVRIIDQPNAGPAIATNAGLNAATGDYIKLVDGDDCLLPWATQELLSCLETEQCAYVISYNRSTLKSEDYNEKSYRKRVDDLAGAVPKSLCFIEDNPLPLLLRQTDGNPTSWLAKRDMFLKHGGCAPHIFIQDYILELGLAAHGAMCVSTVPVFIAPETDKTHVSANEAQTSHDLNMALAEFFRREPGLLRAYGRAGLRRAYSRAWRFLKKQRAPFDEKIRYFGLYIASKISLLYPLSDLIERSACPFKAYGNIRCK